MKKINSKTKTVLFALQLMAAMSFIISLPVQNSVFGCLRLRGSAARFFHSSANTAEILTDWASA